MLYELNKANVKKKYEVDVHPFHIQKKPVTVTLWVEKERIHKSP